MEDLNQHQLILLTLLVSFVTSIGTGIITVSLLEEAPPVVTSTVNRVVEKTIETVVPGPSVPGKNTETVREVTVVVNQEDLVTESIAKNSQSIVRVYETRPQGTEKFYGIGMVTENNLIISAAATAYDPSSYYRVVFADGTDTLVTRESGTNNGVAVFKITDGTTVSPVTFGDEHTLKLGQSLIVLGGDTQLVVSVGTLSSLIMSENSTDVGRLEIALDAKDSAPGALVVTLQGNVVGMRTTETLADGTTRARFIPVNLLRTAMSQISLR